MLLEEFSVVKYIADSKQSWGLTQGKSYAVETCLDYVEKDDDFVTVWNDQGTLAEMEANEYVLNTVDESEWFKARPNQTFVEQY